VAGKDLISLTQAATLRGVSRGRIYALYSQGRLKGQKVGSWLSFERSDVEKLEVKSVGRPKKA